MISFVRTSIYSCIRPYPDELLPTHLRIAEGISWADRGAIASGWINTMRIFSKNEFVEDMAELKLELCDDIEATELHENKYVFDPICPKMITLHDQAREKLAVSNLVHDHRFIFLVNIILAYIAYVLKMNELKEQKKRACGTSVLVIVIVVRFAAIRGTYVYTI